ncbi:MAG TPA: arsenate reductase (glutaredoxin) [Lysobacter sp.]
MPADRPLLLHNKPGCSKCRGALELLRERGIEPEVVDLAAGPPSAERLREIVAMTGAPPRALLRTGEAAYADLGLDDPALPDKRLIDAMAAHPSLIERPILVYRGRAVVGRPPERVLTLLD